ncbi:MAG: GNAT family N-acetyltransferase [Cyanobacteria bacterium J06632_22]
MGSRPIMLATQSKTTQQAQSLHAPTEHPLNTPQFRNMTPADGPTVVALNQAVVDVTSPMDLTRFNALYQLCDLKQVAELNGDVVAFIWGMTDHAAYDNGNYQWFAARLRRFLYIDRIVVSGHCRGMGLGRQLYAQATKQSAAIGALTICAEIDIDPPNPISLRFHEKTGFVQMGTRRLASGKRVSMQILSVAQ